MMKLSDLNPGDQLRTDGGFTCMAEGVSRTVHQHENGDLYVNCGDGKHFLSGQVDHTDGDTLIGLSLIEEGN